MEEDGKHNSLIVMFSVSDHSLHVCCVTRDACLNNCSLQLLMDSGDVPQQFLPSVVDEILETRLNNFLVGPRSISAFS